MRLSAWWLDLSPARKAGFRNVVISALSAAVSFISLAFIAKYYGGSEAGDAYFFLVAVTAFSSGLISVLFSTVFLPEFINIRSSGGLLKAISFFNSILSWTLIIILPTAILTIYFYKDFYQLVSNFSEQQIEINKKILIYFSPIFLLSIIVEYFRTVLLAFERYFISAAIALFQPIILILFLLLLSDSLGVQALPLSILVAKLVSLLLLIYAMVNFEKVRFAFSLAKNNSAIRFFRASTPYWLASLVTNFSGFYFDYIATGLGVGVLTAVTCAQRVYILPASLILSPILDIARVKLSRYRAQGDLDALGNCHNELLQLLIYLATPIAVVYFYIPEKIISTLFQRGNFGEDEVAMTAQCLKILAITLPFSCVFMLNGRTIEVFQRLLWPSFFGTIGNLGLILMTYILVSSKGYIGIPYARLSLDLIYFFPLGFLFLRLYAINISYISALKILIKALLSALVAAIMLNYALSKFSILSSSFGWLELFVGVLFFGVMYAIFICSLDTRVKRLALNMFTPTI